MSKIISEFKNQGGNRIKCVKTYQDHIFFHAGSRSDRKYDSPFCFTHQSLECWVREIQVSDSWSVYMGEAEVYRFDGATWGSNYIKLGVI